MKQLNNGAKNFIPLNKGFICEHCKRTVSPAKGTFRNHCPFCLTSKHVDGAIPGDRAAICGGLMETEAIEGSDPDNLDLLQTCRSCGHSRRNRTARDDDQEMLFRLMEEK